MKKINFLFLLTPLIYLSQVGINTQNPTETLDVNGTLRIRNISKTSSSNPVRDSIVVFEKGVIKRTSANQIIKQVDISNFPSGIRNTDDQQLTLSSNTLTLERGGTPISLSPYLDNTDKQKADVFTLDGDKLKLSLENDGQEDKEIDLSKYINTDNQQITNFKYNPSTHKLSLTLEDGGTKEIDLSSLDDNGTDDQKLTLSSNTLTLERGGTPISLSPYLDNTDKQKADVFTLDGDKLKLSLENDGQEDKEIDLSKYINTDNQQITNFKYNPSTHKLSLTLEDGGTKEIDLSSLDDNGTDDQKLTLSSNTLTLERGGTPISLSPYLDNTDKQKADVFTLDGDKLKLSLENDGQEDKEIDLSKYINTDNQQITNFKYNPSTHKLSLTLEDGGTKEIDLSSLDDNGTDDQKLTLSSNTLTLERGGTPISLSPYLDNTDKQKADVFTLDGDKLKLSLENDGQEDKEIDLSKYLDNTDNQQISEFSYNKSTHQLTLEIKNGGQKKTIDLSSLATPKGAIMMWSGSIDNIPSGWTLCNGQDGTPDLTDRFIVGAGDSYSFGNTGGENKITLTKDQIPDLNGSVTVKKENVNYRDTQFTEGKFYGSNDYIQIDGNEHYSTHGHENRHTSTSISGDKDLWIFYKNRSLTIPQNTGTFTFNRNNQGQKPVENRPPYYALAFIMFVGN